MANRFLRSIKKMTQSGFTLIELIIVIVILSILAAVALPRFINLSTNARSAAVDGMYGSVLAAANLAHSLYLVTGTAPATVTMEGQTINISNGYPAHTADGIGRALTDTTGFTSAANASSGWDFRVTSAVTPASCMVTYVQPTALGNAPTVTATKTDCS